MPASFEGASRPILSSSLPSPSSQSSGEEGSNVERKIPTVHCAVHDVDVLIVGGDPPGSLAAAMLHERKVRTTLVEKQRDFLKFNVSRSYELGLYERGLKTLKSVKGLYKYVEGSGFPNKFFRFVKADGSVVMSDFPMDEIGTIRFFMRFRLLHLFQKFVMEQTDTNAI